jgi:hypothetical protein
MARRFADVTAAVGVEVYVLHPDPRAVPTAHRVRLTPEAGERLISAARDYLIKTAKLTLLPYEPAILVPPGHSLYLAQARAVNLASTEAGLATGNVDALDPSADYARRINLLALRLTLADGNTLTLYRVLKPAFRLGRPKGVLALIERDGRYDLIDSQDLLLVELDFDVLVADGFAVFAKKTTFERAFGFLEELRRKSRATFKRVTRDLRIANIAELERVCTSETGMMNKMASIARSLEDDPDYAKAMTMPKLLRFVRANPALGITCEGSGSEAALVFDNSPQNRFKLLNLLDDDYLHSTLTDREYEAGSKTRQGK